MGDVATPHRHEGGRNVFDFRSRRDSRDHVRRRRRHRCDLVDMLSWARNWLVPTPVQLKWLSPQQRKTLQAPHMLIPVSAQRRAWDDSPTSWPTATAGA
ncbi:hypothetical protein [Rhodanobacter lindaniclasticus]